MKYAGITHILSNKWIYPILLTVSTFVAYFPVMGNGFLYAWDNQGVVINSYTKSGWNRQNLWAVFTEFHHRKYDQLIRNFHRQRFLREAERTKN
jgi:5-methylcytosine-specific restriction endonuclease McrA